MAEPTTDNRVTQVRFLVRVPISLASVPVAQESPKLLDGVRFPGERPRIIKKVVNMKKFNIQEVKDFLLTQGPDTRVYLGADSERLRIDGVWYADYALAVVVHIDGCHGCKIFGFVERELDYDHKKSKPAMRLMNEVYKISNLFQEMADVLEDRHVEVHLDLNKSDEFGSSCVIQQAIGYIKGTCDLTPKVKPDAPAASFCADRLKRILTEQEAVL
jgi:uncharacterized protein